MICIAIAILVLAIGVIAGFAFGMAEEAAHWRDCAESHVEALSDGRWFRVTETKP